jgi:hypothetical protein
MGGVEIVGRMCQLVKNCFLVVIYDTRDGAVDSVLQNKYRSCLRRWSRDSLTDGRSRDNSMDGWSRNSLMDGWSRDGLMDGWSKGRMDFSFRTITNNET